MKYPALKASGLFIEAASRLLYIMAPRPVGESQRITVTGRSVLRRPATQMSRKAEITPKTATGSSEYAPIMTMPSKILFAMRYSILLNRVITV